MIKQKSETGVINPKVTLISSTNNPVGTLFSVWYGSRSEGTLSPLEVQKIYDHKDDSVSSLTSDLIKLKYPKYKTAYEAIQAVCQNLSSLPPMEAVNFTFCIDNATIAWREQVVRGKYQSFWVQTSRSMDLKTMDISMNPSVGKIGGPAAEKIYKNTADTIREAYTRLVDLGVPEEDIRLIPQSSTHRVYWFISLRALLVTLKKRTSWIAQSSLWSPIVFQIIEILRELNLYNIVKDDLMSGVCSLKNKEVTYYPYVVDCEERMRGTDPAPVDPIYLAYSHQSMPEHTNLDWYDSMKAGYIKIWSDEILDLLGWDRNDPKKLGPYDRPSNF